MGACNQGKKFWDFHGVSSGVDTPSVECAADQKVLHITAIMCSTMCGRINSRVNLISQII